MYSRPPIRLPSRKRPGQDGRTHLPRRGGGWRPAQVPPRSPARSGPTPAASQAAPPQASPERKRRGRRLGRGCYRLPALRHPPHGGRPRPPGSAAQGLLERAPPAHSPPGPHPPPPRTRGRRAQPWFRGGRSCAGQHTHTNGPAERERPPQHEGVTSSSSPRLLEPSPSSPPLGGLPPSPPIASYAAACERDVAWETSA